MEDLNRNHKHCTNIGNLANYEVSLIKRVHRRYNIKEDIDSFALKFINKYAERVKDKYCRISCYDNKNCLYNK